MRFNRQSSYVFFLLISICASGVMNTTLAQEPESVATCKALTPSEPQEVSESFKGKIEGRLDGLISRLAGGVAAVEGEYDKLVKDTLKDYPESQKLYVWQKLIYLACLNNGTKIDINELAKAFLVGPTGLALSIKTKSSDIKIGFLGLDTASSFDALMQNGSSGANTAKLPDFIFSYTNVSNNSVHVDLTGCSLINFKYPKPIPATTFQGRPLTILAVSGTTSMNPVGATQVILAPGQTLAKSYSVFSVAALSFEDRRQSKSYCSFILGNGTVFEL